LRLCLHPTAAAGGFVGGAQALRLRRHGAADARRREPMPANTARMRRGPRDEAFAPAALLLPGVTPGLVGILVRGRSPPTALEGSGHPLVIDKCGRRRRGLSKRRFPRPAAWHLYFFRHRARLSGSTGPGVGTPTPRSPAWRKGPAACGAMRASSTGGAPPGGRRRRPRRGRRPSAAVRDGTSTVLANAGPRGGARANPPSPARAR